MIIKNIYNFLKYKRILKEIYKNENFIDNIKNTVDIDFKEDWVGRLYAIINPFIKDGKYDPNAMIYDFNDGKISLDTYVEKTMLEKMNTIRGFIINQNMFDLLTYDVKPVDEFGNYLLVLSPMYFDQAYKDFKKLLKIFGVFTILLVIIIVLLKYYNVI